MSLSYEEGLRMARAMKERGEEIKAAIEKTKREGWGVVALRFSDECREMEIEILDLPVEENVRVFTGKEK